MYNKLTDIIPPSRSMWVELPLENSKIEQHFRNYNFRELHDGDLANKLLNKQGVLINKMTPSPNGVSYTTRDKDYSQKILLRSNAK